jgi:uncharacterized protein YbjT (DUF2867 family)
MGILVTGAGGLIGRAAVAALLQQGIEQVRAVVREPAQVGELRALGAKVAVMDARDPDALQAAMTGVFTACSLTGGVWGRAGAEDPKAAVVEPAATFLAAARTAGVRRVVVLSPAAVGAAATAARPGHGYLAAKAEVERLVRASGLEHAILRCTHVLGPGGRLVARLRSGDPTPGGGHQRVAPVWVDDAARAIALADDAVELRTTWSLAGPTETTLGGLAAALAAGRPGPGGAGGLTPSQVEVLAADSLPDPALPAPPGLVPLPLAEALTRL